MSWMDSWSRPAKSQATPAPYYLLPGGEATPYCHSCGRAIGTRRQVGEKNNKAAAAAADPVVVVKYCSSRCRNRKPGRLDREIEDTFLRLLLGQEKEEAAGEPGDGAAAPAAEKHARAHGGKQRQKTRKAKGDARILVSCSTVEDAMFPQHHAADAADAAEERPGRSSSSHGSHDDDDDDDDDNPATNAQTLHDDLDAPEALHPHTTTTTPPPTPRWTPPCWRACRCAAARACARRRACRRSTAAWAGRRGGRSGSARARSCCGGAWRASGARASGRWSSARRGAAWRSGSPWMAAAAAAMTTTSREEEGGAPRGRRGRRGGKKSSLGTDGNHNGGEEKDGTGGRRRYCEAVMNGKVVEPSFAKGNWGIRWREE
ncbi:hypothetical protein PG999_001481 [Apiospora kogelbergensis]|uniref:Uncharacterized protein n=1 Tax=Apiospora kogelbergensis TaxID=1337665 RepID=A0AAW0REP4_9PEZI